MHIFIFWFLDFEPRLGFLFRAYSCLSTQESLLKVLWWPYGVPAIKLRSVEYKASTLFTAISFLIEIFK